MQLPTMQRQAYIQSTLDFNRNFYIWSLRKPISLLGGSSDSIVKVIKLLHNVPKANTNRFAIYHLHYKDKLSNLTWSLVCTTNNFYFLSNFNNLSVASPLFISNCKACATQLGLVIKKGELLEISSIYIPDTWIERVRKAKTLFLLLSSTLSKIHPAISKYMTIFK